MSSNATSTATVTRLRVEPVTSASPPSARAPRKPVNRKEVIHVSAPPFQLPEGLVTRDELAAAVSVIREEMVASAATIAASIRDTPVPVPVAPQGTDDGLMNVIVSSFGALAYALSARALLLLSLIGAFVLAVMATERGGMMGLGVLIAYSLLTVCPVAWLEARKQFRGETNQ